MVRSVLANRLPFNKNPAMKKHAIWLLSLPIATVLLLSGCNKTDFLTPETADNVSTLGVGGGDSTRKPKGPKGSMDSTHRKKHRGDSTHRDSTRSPKPPRDSVNTVPITDVPATVVGYINTNYAGYGITRVQGASLGYAVLISNAASAVKLLLFDADWVFVRELSKPEGTKPPKDSTKKPKKKR
jgi:hypothetical protein